MPATKGRKQVTNRKPRQEPQALPAAMPPDEAARPSPGRQAGRQGKLRNRTGAAAYTGLSLTVLDQLAKEGRGPRRVQVTPDIWRYNTDDLDRWMANLPEATA